MHEAAVWLRAVRAEIGDELPPVEWRGFSLEEVNREGDGPRAWEAPEGEGSTLVAFRGAEAARRQGAEAFDGYHHALLALRHEQGMELDRAATIRAAVETGVDLERFEADLDAPDALAALARDHEGGTALGVFGTPTLFFGEGRGAYLKMRPASRGEDARRAYDAFRLVVAEEVNIGEIKRPTP